MPKTKTSEIAQAMAGKAVREARLSEDLTQRQLADKLGVNATYVTNVEAGRTNVTIGQLATIAEAMQTGLEIQLLQLSNRHVRIAPPQER